MINLKEWHPQFLKQIKSNLSPSERRDGNAINALIASHAEQIEDEEAALQARLNFLKCIEERPKLLNKKSVAHFLATEIRPEDFDGVQWTTPAQMIEFCDKLYGFRFEEETLREQVGQHIGYLLQRALSECERAKDWEDLFALVQLAPTSPLMDDVELRRLRHLAHSYELRRVRRNLRILYSYLSLQALLVLVVFPLLFINAENGELQRRVEELTDVAIGDEGYRLITFADGVYWSVVTAASIGYGDITPMTTTGKIVAGILGTIGVVTVGVVAGLVLKWVTPRALD